MMIRPAKKLPRPRAAKSALPSLFEMRENGQAVALSINGQFKYEIQDADSLGQLILLIDRLETLEGIRRGLKEAEEGKGRPIEDFMAEVKERYGL